MSTAMERKMERKRQERESDLTAMVAQDAKKHLQQYSDQELRELVEEAFKEAERKRLEDEKDGKKITYEGAVDLFNKGRTLIQVLSVRNDRDDEEATRLFINKDAWKKVNGLKWEFDGFGRMYEMDEGIEKLKEIRGFLYA